MPVREIARRAERKNRWRGRVAALPCESCHHPSFPPEHIEPRLTAGVAVGSGILMSIAAAKRATENQTVRSTVRSPGPDPTASLGN